MDKLTSIKLKNPDGTYSDEILISALAQNVTYDNTHNMVDVVDELKDSIKKVRASDGNLLFDTYTKAEKVDGPSNPYISDSGNSGTVATWIDAEDLSDSLPDPNATCILRLTANTGTGQRALAFYSGATDFPPIQDGQYYRIGCYAKANNGSPLLRLRFSGNVANYQTFQVTSEWQWYDFTAKFVYSAASESTTYRNSYFYMIPQVEGDSLDMCGFRLQRAKGVVNSEPIINDNLLLRSKDLSGWARYSNVTLEKDPTEDDINMFHWPAVETVTYRDVTPNSPGIAIPYKKIRNKRITLSYWIKIATPSVGLTNLAYVVFSLTDSPGNSRLRWSSNQVPAYAKIDKNTSEWQKISFTKQITDQVFANGSTTITDDLYFYIQFYNHSSSESWMKKPKLEFGVIETEWCESKYDNILGTGKNLLKNPIIDIFNSNTYNIVNLNFGDKKPVAGKPYTIQIKGQLGTGKTGWGIYNSGDYVYQMNYNPTNNGTPECFYDEETGIYTIKIQAWKTTRESTTASNTYLALYQIPEQVSSPSSIEWVKMEEGTVPSVLESGFDNFKMGSNNLLRGADFSKMNGAGSAYTTGQWQDGMFIGASSGNGSINFADIEDPPIDVPSIESVMRITNNTSGNKDFQQKGIPIEPNTDYTFSAYIRTINNNTNVRLLSRFWDSGTGAIASSVEELVIGSEWVRWSAVKNSGSPTNNTLYFSLGVNGASGDIEICAPQLEKGTIATGWGLSEWDKQRDKEDAVNRNLLINTWKPSKTSAYRVKILGQTQDSKVNTNNVLSITDHGVKVAVGATTNYPYYRFGSATVTDAAAGMNGLQAGKTYTMSFDVNYKLYSGSPPDATAYYFRLYLYTATASSTDFTTTGDYYTVHSYLTSDVSDRGTEFTNEKVKWTFTIKPDVTKIHLVLKTNATTSSYFAEGDYIEFKNMKLEKGSVATDYCPALEDFRNSSGSIYDYETTNIDELPLYKTFGTMWINCGANDVYGTKPVSSGQGILMTLEQSANYARQYYIAVTPGSTILSKARMYTYATGTWGDWADAKITNALKGSQSPLIVTAASSMSDTNKIYAYMGSEDGYIQGNWYYYNNSAWTSGGVYRNEWQDITSIIISYNTSVVTTSSSLQFFYNPFLNEVYMAGDLTLSLAVGSNTIGTIINSFKSKTYYLAFDAGWNANIFNCMFVNRTSLRIYTNQAYTGQASFNLKYVPNSGIN